MSTRGVGVLCVSLAMTSCSLVVPGDDELKGAAGSVGAAGSGATGPGGSSQGGAGTGGMAGAGGTVTPAFTIYTPTKPVDYTNPTCTDYDNAPTIPFTGYKGATDNTIACRLVWVPDGGVIHACCEIGDMHLQASHSPGGDGDSNEYWLDDSFEMILSAGLERKNSETTIKTAITVAGAHWDGNFPDDQTNPRYDGLEPGDAHAFPSGTIDQPDDTDAGYTLKWKTKIGFPVEPGDVAMCNFLLNDDDPGGASHWIAFGSYDQFNWPPEWQPCLFVDSPAPM